MFGTLLSMPSGFASNPVTFLSGFSWLIVCGHLNRKNDLLHMDFWKNYWMSINQLAFDYLNRILKIYTTHTVRIHERRLIWEIFLKTNNFVRGHWFWSSSMGIFSRGCISSKSSHSQGFWETAISKMLRNSWKNIRARVDF